jgi:hypothetical protein
MPVSSPGRFVRQDQRLSDERDMKSPAKEHDGRGPRLNKHCWEILCRPDKYLCIYSLYDMHDVTPGQNIHQQLSSQLLYTEAITTEQFHKYTVFQAGNFFVWFSRERKTEKQV